MTTRKGLGQGPVRVPVLRIIPAPIPGVCRYINLPNRDEYWAGDVEMALKPHPVVNANAATVSGPFLAN